MNAHSPILVTGAAGFIGFHLAERLLQEGYRVVGFDNLNAYYDPALKQARLQVLGNHTGFEFVRGDLMDVSAVEKLFAAHQFKIVLHMAAQAGVRYSLSHPQAYVDSNITGFLSILEACRAYNVQHLIYASSSSVYGANQKQPFAEGDTTDHPISLYAASKKANELMAHTYAHLYGLPTTGLRFFTVYGPWGRPDMALFKFTKAIFEGTPIDVYNSGDMYRGFTYIDDVVESIVRLIPLAPKPDATCDMSKPVPYRAAAPYRIYNVGSARSIKLADMIMMLEAEIGRKAQVNNLPLQLGDVLSTESNICLLEAATGYAPRVKLEEGLRHFVRWYCEFHEIIKHKLP